LARDSPDESRTGANIRVFPALLQDKREVWTATGTFAQRYWAVEVAAVVVAAAADDVASSMMTVLDVAVRPFWSVAT